MIRPLLQTGILTALAFVTSGCVAAALPVLAGGVIARKELGAGKPPGEPPVTTAAALGPEPKPAAQRAEPLVVVESPRPPEPTGELPAIEAAAVPPADLPAELLAAANPPPPIAPAVLTDRGSIAAFAAHTLGIAGAPPGFGSPRQSVLIDPASLIAGPSRLPCKNQPLAVAIDLDPGLDPLDLADPPAPAPGLAEALGAVRSAGVTVFWTSRLPLDKADRVYALLRATGLDMDGTDRLLLVRKAGETVQQRRLGAARDWCFVAFAGDRPGDFEEALDFLRDPNGPIARAMEPLRGSGWFVIPNPIN